MRLYTLFAFISLALFGMCRAEPVEPVSPEIERLSGSASNERVAAFWGKIEADGAPLTERADGDETLVTFVYRAAPEEAIYLETNLDVATPDAAPIRLKNIPETDVHYYTMMLRDDLRATYHFLVGPERTPVLDPMNSQTHEMVPGFPRSAFALENAPAQPWRDAALSGNWRERRFHSAIYDQEAVIDVYTPAGFAKCDEKAVLIGMDRYAYKNALPAARITEYLRSEKDAPCILVVAAPDLGEPDEAGGYGKPIAFLADDLVPWLEKEYHTDFVPDRTIISGLSRRGMVASHAAFSRPDVYGAVLSLTGTYVWSPEGDPEPEWLTRQYAKADRKPVRIFAAAGLLETAISLRNGGIYPLAANRHFRDVLTAKEYDFQYREFYGVHSTYNWQDMLAPGLEFLLLSAS